MKAIVNIAYRDMQGRAYEVKEIVGTRVTLEYVICIEHTAVIIKEVILVDFNIDEVQIIFDNNNVEVYRNQGHREGYFVNYSPKYGYAIAYIMPNGKVFRNVVKNPFDTSNYKAISKKEYTNKFLTSKN